MTPKTQYDNVVEALCSHYNFERGYNTIVGPVADRLSRRSTLAVLAGTGAAIAATAYLVKLSRRAAHMKIVEQRIQNAQQRRAGEFDAVKSQLLSSPVAEQDEQAINHAIDNDGPYAVFQAVRERRFRLQDVIRVYQKRCIRAQEICNPITHMMVNAAGEAAKLEERIQRGESLPPLYGLVFSVKEMHAVAGTDSTSGLTFHLGELVSEDGVIVKTMRQMGAVLLCKTNFPQTLLSFAAANPIYGAVRNPHNTERAPGGSSSGEAVLQSLGCVMLGWGSDIAGSLRVPGNFSGVAAFKAIVGRFSGRGVLEVVRNSKEVEDAYGMLSRDVRLIALVHKAFWESSKNGMLANEPSPAAPPILWREELFQDKKPLRIGYFTDDGFFPCMPGVKRAVNLAANALSGNGHTLVPFEFPDAARMEEVFFQCLWGDRLRDQYNNLKDEQIDESQKKTFLIASTQHAPHICNWLRRKLVLADAHRMSPQFGKIMKEFYKIQKPEDLSAASQEANALRALFTDKCRQLNLDVLLCPNTPFPPLKLGDEKDKFYAIAYVSRFNLLNLPAGAVPVTWESVDDQKALDGYPETDEVRKILKESARGALGLPLGVQVVSCNRYQEEVALRVMAELQQTVGKEFVLNSSKLLNFTRFIME